ncbi:hypothetical protein D3C86_1183310 [compost metagenome]
MRLHAGELVEHLGRQHRPAQPALHQIGRCGERLDHHPLGLRGVPDQQACPRQDANAKRRDDEVAPALAAQLRRLGLDQSLILLQNPPRRTLEVRIVTPRFQSDVDGVCRWWNTCGQRLR